MHTWLTKHHLQRHRSHHCRSCMWLWWIGVNFAYEKPPYEVMNATKGTGKLIFIFLCVFVQINQLLRSSWCFVNIKAVPCWYEKRTWDSNCWWALARPQLDQQDSVWIWSDKYEDRVNLCKWIMFWMIACVALCYCTAKVWLRHL